MKDWPQPLWALLLAFQGFLLASLALFSSAEKDIKIAVLGIAGSIITGSLGYIGGHLQASKGTIETSATLPIQPAPTAAPELQPATNTRKG
jgi:hypothetical protein